MSSFCLGYFLCGGRRLYLSPLLLSDETSPMVPFEKNSGEFLFANQLGVQFTPGSLTPTLANENLLDMLNSGRVEWICHHLAAIS